MKPLYPKPLPFQTVFGRYRWFRYGIFLLGVGLSASLIIPRTFEGKVVPVDGDSFYIGNLGVRLIGIDAPEWAQTCEKDGAKWPCGEAAADLLSKLVGDVTVKCRGGRRDHYDRLLAVCSAGSVELNREMVEQGFAIAKGGYADSEARAKARKVGIWAGKFDDPKLWRQAFYSEKAIDHRTGHARHRNPRLPAVR